VEKIPVWAHAHRDPKKTGDWIHFCMKWHRTLNSYQIFKNEIKKSKTFCGWCPFQGLPGIQWYHSHVDQIWPDGTFNRCSVEKKDFRWLKSNIQNIWKFKIFYIQSMKNQTILWTKMLDILQACFLVFLSHNWVQKVLFVDM